MSAPKPIDQWAVVDLFGHTRIAGRISEHVIGGCSFVRVDVPALGDQAEFTELFGQGAIYAIRFVTEEIARGVAEATGHRPITMYDLPREMQKRLQSLPVDNTVGRVDACWGEYGDDRDDGQPLGECP